MAETSLPFSTQANDAPDWKNLIGAISRSGVVSGLAVSAPGGMAVSVALGTAIVEGFFYNNDAAKSLVIGAAPGTAGQTRLDYVILKLDVAAKTITAQVKAGTATSGGGTPPALTQSAAVWEVALASVSVANGAVNVTSGMITNMTNGIPVPIIPYINTAVRPTPDENSIGLNITDRSIAVFIVGVGWNDLAVTWGAVSGKPSTFTPASHTHPATGISDSGTTGRAVMQASTRDAARAALGFSLGTGQTGMAVGDIRFRDA